MLAKNDSVSVSSRRISTFESICSGSKSFAEEVADELMLRARELRNSHPSVVIGKDKRLMDGLIGVARAVLAADRVQKTVILPVRPAPVPSEPPNSKAESKSYLLNTIVADHVQKTAVPPIRPAPVPSEPPNSKAESKTIPTDEQLWPAGSGDNSTVFNKQRGLLIVESRPTLCNQDNNLCSNIKPKERKTPKHFKLPKTNDLNVNGDSFSENGLHRLEKKKGQKNVGQQVRAAFSKGVRATGSAISRMRGNVVSAFKK